MNSKAHENGNKEAFGYAATGSDGYDWHSPGLTKREYIAIVAMQAIIINRTYDPVRVSVAEEVPFHDEGGYVATITAKAALLYADALLKELGGTNG